MRIGVFDSGIGGLTVLRELRRRCPGHSTVYLGDTARVPYGAKSPETVRRYALHNAEFLLRQRIDWLVIACNTASAFAMEELAGLPVPVTGVIEPGAELAVRRARGERIGVLGTAGTVRSGAYDRAIRARDPAWVVESIACPLFVPLVEEGWTQNAIARAAAEKYLEPWIGKTGSQPSAVILGCTHYPMLEPLLREVLGPEVALIDSAEAVAIQVQSEVVGKTEEDHPEHRLFLTDASEEFVRLARDFLGDRPESTDSIAPEIELIDLAPMV